MVPTENWSARAIQISKELIAESSHVYFDVKGTQGDYQFGDLNFQMPYNRLVSLEKCLSDLDQIIIRVDFHKGEYIIYHLQISNMFDLIYIGSRISPTRPKSDEYISERFRPRSLPVTC